MFNLYLTLKYFFVMNDNIYFKLQLQVRPCGNTQFKCSDGVCIPKSVVCDKNKDCADGSDELETRCKVRVIF